MHTRPKEVQVNIAEKIARLFEKEGNTIHVYTKGKRFGFLDHDILHGWIWVEEKDDHWHVTFAENMTKRKIDKDYAYGADFLKDTGKPKTGPSDITGAWIVSAKTEPVTDVTEAERIFQLISDHVQMACDYYYEQ